MISKKDILTTIEVLKKTLDVLEAEVLGLQTIEQDDGAGTEYKTRNTDKCYLCGNWIPRPGLAIPVDNPREKPKMCTCPIPGRLK